jgi:hypothetical protein
VAGVAGCLGVLTLLTVGPFLLLGTLLVSAWLLWRFNFGWAMGGLLSGAALPVLYVAWLNRDGPGDVCSSTATTQTCTEQWRPRTIEAVAHELLVAWILVFAPARRS